MYSSWSLLSTAILAILTCWDFSRVSTATPVRLTSTYHINGKRAVNTVSERYLSFTLPPDVVTHVTECPEWNSSSKLFRPLLPAYLRLAGPYSNKLLFQSLPDSKPLTSEQRQKSANFIVTGSQWLKFIDFSNKTGMNVIVSLNGGILDKDNNLDLTNALDFISFSNKNNLNLDWQLGFEVQRMANDDGKSMGHDVNRLRQVLQVFPRYQNSLILGPDMTNLENRADIAFIRNYLSEAQNSLNAFTIHPDFSNMKDSNDEYEMLSKIFVKMDNYLWVKEGVLKSASKGVVPKKPIWIAESENKDHLCKFSDTISFVRRLGAAARLGASVYLRNPHLLSLFEPTPEYWVSVLYKALVGKTVLDTKLITGNSTKVHVYSHCTPTHINPQESIIDVNTAYERGAVTIYGVNDASEPSRFSFKMGVKPEETVHFYSLTADNSEPMLKTLLNRQPLGLSPDHDLPVVLPKIRESIKSIVLPPKSIFFVVLPQANSRACLSQSADEYQKIKLPTGTTEDEEIVDNQSTLENTPEIFVDDELTDSNRYVWFPKSEDRTRIPATINQQPKRQSQAATTTRISTMPAYITYSDDTWLSTLPENLQDMFNKEQLRPTSSGEVHRFSAPSRKETKAAKLEQYKLLTKAILGKRDNVQSQQQQQQFDYGEDQQSTTLLQAPHNSTERVSRSVLDNDPQWEEVNENDFLRMNNNQDADLEDADADATATDTRDDQTKPIPEEMYDRKRRAIVDSVTEVVTSQASLPSDPTVVMNEKISLLPTTNQESSVSLADLPSNTQNNSSSPKMLNSEAKDLELLAAAQHFILESDNSDMVRMSREAAELDKHPLSIEEVRRSYNSVHPVSPFPRKPKKPKLKSISKTGRSMVDDSVPITENTVSAANIVMPPTQPLLMAVSSTPMAPEQDTITNEKMVAAVMGPSTESTTTSTTSKPPTSAPTSNSKTALFTESNTPTPVTITAEKTEAAETHSAEPELETPTVPANIDPIDLKSRAVVSLTRNPIFKAKPLRRKEPTTIPKSDPVYSTTKPAATRTTPTPIIKPKARPTPAPTKPKLTPKSASEIIEIHNAKLKKLVDDTMAKIHEIKEKVFSRSLKQQVREKRDTSASAGDQQQSQHIHTDVIPSPQNVATKEHRHGGLQIPTAGPKSARKDVRIKPARQRRRPAARNSTNVFRKDKALLRHRRDLMDDACGVAKGIYSDMKDLPSTAYETVKHSMQPVSLWIGDQWHKLKDEIFLERRKRELTPFESGEDQSPYKQEALFKLVEDEIQEVKSRWEKFLENHEDGKRVTRDVHANDKLDAIKSQVEEHLKQLADKLHNRQVTVEPKPTDSVFEPRIAELKSKLEEKHKQLAEKISKLKITNDFESRKAEIMSAAEARRKKLAETLDHIRIIRDVTQLHPHHHHHRTRFADQPIPDMDNHQRRYVFRLKLLQNATARNHSLHKPASLIPREQKLPAIHTHAAKAAATPLPQGEIVRKIRSLPDPNWYDESHDNETTIMKNEISDDDVDENEVLHLDTLDKKYEKSTTPLLDTSRIITTAFPDDSRMDKVNGNALERDNENIFWSKPEINSSRTYAKDDYDDIWSHKNFPWKSSTPKTTTTTTATTSTTSAAPETTSKIELCDATYFMNYMWCRCKNILTYVYSLLSK